MGRIKVKVTQSAGPGEDEAAMVIPDVTLALIPDTNTTGSNVPGGMSLQLTVGTAVSGTDTSTASTTEEDLSYSASASVIRQTYTLVISNIPNGNVPSGTNFYDSFASSSWSPDNTTFTCTGTVQQAGSTVEVAAAGSAEPSREAASPSFFDRILMFFRRLFGLKTT